MLETECQHDWMIGGAWGVILGVSRCAKCDTIATIKHFPNLVRKGLGAQPSATHRDRTKYNRKQKHRSDDT